MEINISYQYDSCLMDVSPEATLPEVSFAIESIVSNFLGCGVSKFECSRTKASNGTCTVLFRALMKSGPMVISKVMTVSSAVKTGTFPFDLENSFKDKKEVAKEGQHKHSVPTFKENSTIIDSGGFDANLPLSFISYGLSDLFTGLFAMGIKYIKWQGSQNQSQVYFEHNIPTKTIIDFLGSKIDYDINRKVSTL